MLKGASCLLTYQEIMIEFFSMWFKKQKDESSVKFGQKVNIL